ncbi:MBL fold metallo-hydrolase [Pyrococcus abyssi]|uniref:Alkylphosphonate uptake/carbon-phosphorus lyase, membrane bound subunit, phnP homolog n=1 Tax=Pyrococcus abyssi (strain GE5 / Orsay) TaxID=272844 RepID=Q9V171_PYRAB|nr:MBL fold metallo-hydrolase [Pyrococcus abyssi]CAB49479.1 Alkylphosphonate uptake/carbon-phosphorus lyase, membrane bound subunit, phnP homolog [Pyrococcus abyssi GE5]CCE69947.1 TPA: atp-binding protein phnp (phnp) [Pyrococcus abyssi GE5]
MIVYFIGTGGSEGIPVHLCNCRSCNEARKFGFAQRRPSTLAIIGNKGEVVLIDVGTDIREFLNTPIDAIFLTHWHHDHIYGLYKLRWIARETELYAPRGHADALILQDPKNLKPNIIRAGDKIKINGLKITAVKLNHQVETLGYIIEENGKNVAVLYDTKGLPRETEIILEKLSPLRLAIVDATYPPGFNDPYHNNVDEAGEMGIKYAERVVLSHISHKNLPFLELVNYVRRKWDDRVLVAYDGMVFYV